MPWTFGICCERVARDDLHDVGQAGALDVVGELLRAHGVVLDRDQLPPVSRSPMRHPDRAVAAGAANLERVLRAARRDHQPEESPVLFRHGQLALVLGLDLRQELLHFGRLRRRRHRHPPAHRNRQHHPHHHSHCLLHLVPEISVTVQNP